MCFAAYTVCNQEQQPGAKEELVVVVQQQPVLLEMQTPLSPTTCVTLQRVWMCVCVCLCAPRFRGDTGLLLLQKGGPLVIRRLCAAMGPEVVFREFASILDVEPDLAFASTMVQVCGSGCVNT